VVLKAVNPTTGETIREYEETRPEEVGRIVEAAHEAFLAWRKSGFSQRTGLMKNAARILRENRDEYARLMAREMGKPVRDGRAEVEKCSWACDYYAENAERFLQPETVGTEASQSFVAFEPLGVVLAVMPWNFPFWQVFRFAVPAIMAGNTVVLKHASNVPGCALEVEDVFHNAGFPDGIFRTLLVASEQVTRIIEHPLVKAATVTGSTAAGRAVAARAGEMIKKTVLELGGSDPYVVLEDADLEAAVACCVASRMTNGGQSCIAAKRLIVVEPLREQFEQLCVERMGQEKMGDPLWEETTLGPMARHDLRDELHRQVLQSIEKGARCIMGGQIPDSRGAFYPPTVLSNVAKGMPAYDEELFGPVAAVVPARDEEEAIRTANDSSFGLGAAVFTRDTARGKRIATTELEAGCCFVNDLVRSDPRLPFGGMKDSGYGRELSHYGIKEFVNIKTVYVR